MACFKPLEAWQTSDGLIHFHLRPDSRPLLLPCAQCIGCRLERSRQWAVRCLHEAQMHKWSSFVTLTYDDEHVPVDMSLRYSDFQLFMRRVRKHFRSERQRIRFYMCGEYGETTSRPHFHACLFGAFFPDRVLFKRMDSGSNLYTSVILDSLWSNGFCSVGDVTFESAAYVARYIMKKVTGDAADQHYRCVDSDGVVYWREPEFNSMSLKPGIGAEWFKKFHCEVYPRDYVVVNGLKVRPPKYYDKLAADFDAYMMDDIAFDRETKMSQFLGDCTVDRLRVREIVTKARLRFKLRTLE